MSNPQFSTITYEQDGGVAVITLNRPEKMNALSRELMEDLQNGLRHALDGGQTRAILLTANGRGFCAGADLSAARGEGADIDAGMRDYFNPTLQFVAECPLPLVVAVNGAAAGAGSSLALLGDIVIAGESAYFQQAFANIGLVPDTGASWLLTHTLGPVRANALMMLGDKLPAKQAAEWGLVLRAVPDAELQTEARALAQRLASRATVALSLIKRLTRMAANNSLRDQMLLEMEFQRTARFTEDSKEARQAFLDKRPAQFKGR
ncbi:enoyl-CoA hydratase-related protein [Comamonas serinivorans]|nr:enoyl-CoA hydratase-related protein [Comamonas serinivorans]